MTGRFWLTPMMIDRYLTFQSSWRTLKSGSRHGRMSESACSCPGRPWSKGTPCWSKSVGWRYPINVLHIEIDDRCLKLLALHQPMAVDLRAIVAAVKINTDLERVGDLAVNIAEAARRYGTHPPVKKLIDIPRMAAIAQQMLRDSLDAFVRRDVELAQQVLNQDDILDGLKTQVFRELLTYMLQDPATIEPRSI